jgi:hypothetical protein
MELEFTVVAIKLGDDSFVQTPDQLRDTADVSLRSFGVEDDPVGQKVPNGYANISCSGEVARSIRLGAKFKLVSVE